MGDKEYFHNTLTARLHVPSKSPFFNCLEMNLTMGYLVLFIHNVKKNKGAAHKNEP